MKAQQQQPAKALQSQPQMNESTLKNIIKETSFRNGHQPTITSQTPLLGNKNTIKVVRKQLRPTTAVGGNLLKTPQKAQNPLTHIDQSKTNLYADPNSHEYNEFIKGHNPNQQSIDSFSKKHSIKFVAKRYSEQAYLESVLQDNGSTQASKNDIQSVCNNTRFKMNSRALNQQLESVYDQNDSIKKKGQLTSNTIDPIDDYFRSSQNFKRQSNQNSVDRIDAFCLSTDRKRYDSQQYPKRHVLGQISDYVETGQSKYETMKKPLNPLPRQSKQPSNTDSQNLLAQLNFAMQNKINTTAGRQLVKVDKRPKTIYEQIPMKEKEIDKIIENIEDRIFENKVKEYQQILKKPKALQMLQTRNQRVIDSHEKIIITWEKQKNLVCNKIKRENNQSVMTQSEQFRSRVEIQNLLDKGSSLREKYGDQRGWRISLRYNENAKGEDGTLEYREVVGPLHQGISLQIKDERKKPIEIVRRSAAAGLQQTYDSNRFIKINNQRDGFKSLQQSVDNLSQSIDFKGPLKQLRNQSKNNSRPQTASSKIRDSNLVRLKFQHNQKLLNELLPTTQDEDEFIDLKVEGINVLEKEKEAVRKLKLQKNLQKQLESQQRKMSITNGGAGRAIANLRKSILKNLSGMGNQEENEFLWERNPNEKEIEGEEIIIQDFQK